MKLTYWVAVCLDDADAYSIRTRTKRECVARVAGQRGFAAPKRVTVEYDNAFDLLTQTTAESRLWWEYAEKSE